jgi:hypothetical protein
MESYTLTILAVVFLLLAWIGYYARKVNAANPKASKPPSQKEMLFGKKRHAKKKGKDGYWSLE